MPPYIPASCTSCGEKLLRVSNKNPDLVCNSHSCQALFELFPKSNKHRKFSLPKCIKCNSPLSLDPDNPQKLQCTNIQCNTIFSISIVEVGQAG